MGVDGMLFNRYRIWRIATGETSGSGSSTASLLEAVNCCIGSSVLTLPSSVQISANTKKEVS